MRVCALMSKKGTWKKAREIGVKKRYMQCDG